MIIDTTDSAKIIDNGDINRSNDKFASVKAQMSRIQSQFNIKLSATRLNIMKEAKITLNPKILSAPQTCKAALSRKMHGE